MSREEQLQDPLAKSCLPKGVTHGCPDCSGCRKVTGRWHPEEARTDLLEEAPLFYPTEEFLKEFGFVLRCSTERGDRFDGGDIRCFICKYK
ncbi:putative lysine-specific demethylase JMJ16 isoform X3 [Malus domestica]|uniref:putative lysine-specific demethylase JMJ16 isoform X3 n=1 Tax=Malus domestica TaxID=3750 RepID=UPI003976E772